MCTTCNVLAHDIKAWYDVFTACVCVSVYNIESILNSLDFSVTTLTAGRTAEVISIVCAVKQKSIF